MNILPKFVIMSAFKSELDNATNWAKHSQLLTRLANNGFTTKQVNGVYEGVSERSILVLFHSKAELCFLEFLAHEYKQESILEVDHERSASLLYQNGERVRLAGKFTRVSEETAKREIGYTETDGMFYAVVS